MRLLRALAIRFRLWQLRRLSMTPRRGPWIMTASGRPFWPADPRPEDISVLDLAHHLSLECRYAGACGWHYSVAQHSVLVSRLVPAEAALWGLLHDAAEAYIKDIPRPLKDLFGVTYRMLEAGILAAVASQFNLALPIPAAVHEADNRLLMTERAVLLPAGVDLPGPWGADAPPYPGVQIERWTPPRAEEEFLSRFWELILHHWPAFI